MTILTPEDVARGRAGGLRRSGAGRRRGGTHRYGWRPAPEHQREVDSLSAVAELLVAKATGRRWLSEGLEPDDPLAGDVEGGIQVRWTDRQNGCLIVHPEDPDSLIYTLVCGPVDSMRIIGWLNGDECKQQKWWREDVRYPAYFVPKIALRPLMSLPPLGRSCSRCGDDGTLARVGEDRWLCRDCFFDGPGKTWPWPQSVPFRAKPPMRA